MIEIIALGLLALAMSTCVFSLFPKFKAAKLAAKLHVPEDSTLKRHFLTHLRYEDALLADELEKRLAKAQ